MNNKHFRLNVKDEYFTPSILVKQIIPYLKPKSKIWCPFDEENSEFVILLREAGHEVIYTHIKHGQDFFKIIPPIVDYAISNPPFSLKLDVFKRLYMLNIPFAMVMNLQILNYHEISDFFIGRNYELLIPNKRISFDGNPIPFMSCFFCNKVLPKQIVHVGVQHSNIGKHFIPSSMYNSFKKAA